MLAKNPAKLAQLQLGYMGITASKKIQDDSLAPRSMNPRKFSIFVTWNGSRKKRHKVPRCSRKGQKHKLRYFLSFQPSF